MGLRPLRIASLLLAVVVAGCAESVPPTTGPADGASDPDQATSSDLVQPVGGDLRLGEPWFLVGGTLEHQTDTEVTLTFEAEFMAGQGPINSYSAEYVATPDGSLEIGEWATTAIGAAGEDPEFEAELLRLLGEVDGYTTVAAGELYLFAGDVNVLVYSAAPQPADGDLTITEETEALAASVVGMAEAQAQETVEAADHTWRVVARDGVSFPVTEDYSPTRINATIDDGIVTETTIG